MKKNMDLYDKGTNDIRFKVEHSEAGEMYDLNIN
jgi:hypothetical protein